MPAVPSWLLDPLWDQFSALLPARPLYDPAHPLGCHRPRIADRVIFEKILQVLRFGCSYAAIADCSCGATTIRERRDEWIEAGIFAELNRIVREAYDRIVGLVLEDLLIDGCAAKAPGGGQVAGRSPVDRGKLGYKRSLLTDGKGIPLDRVLAPANRHDSPLLVPTLDKLDEAGPLPEEVTVHLDAGYDSGKTRAELESRGLNGEIAHKGEKAPIQAGRRWPVERTKCAARRFAVFPAQPGGIRREVPGSNGLPGPERLRGQEHARQPGGRAQWSGTARRGDPRDMAKAGLPESQSPVDASSHPPERPL